MKIKLESEKEIGNIEYKIKLCKNTEYKITQLSTQMLYRLYQGNGYVIYYIGVCDNGDIVGISETDLNNSVLLLKKASNKIGAKFVNSIKINVEKTDRYYMKIIFKKKLNLSLIDDDEY